MLITQAQWEYRIGFYPASYCFYPSVRFYTVKNFFVKKGPDHAAASKEKNPRCVRGGQVANRRSTSTAFESRSQQ